MKNKQIFLMILTIFLVSFVSASYTFVNYSIGEQYPIGSDISGYINISFQNESLNSFFEDSFGNQIFLKNILNKSKDYSYNCTYKNCASSYESSNPEISKKFFLKKGEKKTIGFILKGNIKDINSASFFLTSDANESASNQIEIDILDDGVGDIGNSKSGTELIGKENYGCFNQSENPQEISLSSTPYCQEVSLNESPKIMLGEWIKEDVAGSNPITMSIYDGDGSFLGKCNLLKGDITSQGSESFCNVNLSITKKGNYFVCSSIGEGLGKYKLLGYSSKNNCGFLGLPIKNRTATYKIGVRSSMFATPSTIQIGNKLPNNKFFSSLIKNYINSHYKNVGCVDGCYIPITFLSFSNQNITLNSLDVNYDSLGLLGSHLTTFYDFKKKDSTVSSLPQKLSLDGLFPLPKTEGKIQYILKFKGEKLFEKKISLENFPMNLYPLEVASGFPTKFFIFTSGKKGSSYLWDFGDNSTKLTVFPTVTHTYSKKGNFTLTISVISNENKFSKSFSIKTIPIREFAEREISLKKQNLEEIEKQISGMGTFEKKEIEKAFSIESLKKSLTNIEEKESEAVSDEDYRLLTKSLLSLSFPKTILETNSNKVSFVPSENSINLNVLNDILGTNYSEEKSNLDYASFWNYKNLNTKILTKNVILKWENGSRSSIYFYSISITPKKPIEENYYFILTKNKGIKFKDSSIIKNGSDFIYVPLTNKPTSFSFMSEEDLEDSFFITPQKISNLKDIKIEESKNTTQTIIIGLILVILIGFILYFVLHRWYKLKYEKFLFPDKNQLYNAMIYINNSRKKEMSEKEIKEELLRVGWKKEQVIYLLKKYSGKRTGMIDIFSFLKKKKIKKNIEPPNPGRNANFTRYKSTKFNKP